MSWLETPTGTKGGPFIPVGGSNRDKRPLSPPLARLAVGPGTKATYCPGPKGCRDKRPETKAYSVIVIALFRIIWHISFCFRYSMDSSLCCPRFGCSRFCLEVHDICFAYLISHSFSVFVNIAKLFSVRTWKVMDDS